jgi:hypothetical protein
MGIVRHDLTPAERVPGTVWDDKPCVSADLWVPCDRCRVAQAQVEVVTDAGSVFLCQHHHKEHRDAIVAAGHLTRAWQPGSGFCSEVRQPV